MENLIAFQKFCKPQYEIAQQAVLTALAGFTASEALAVLDASRAEIGQMLSWKEKSRQNALRVSDQDRLQEFLEE